MNEASAHLLSSCIVAIGIFIFAIFCIVMTAVVAKNGQHILYPIQM